MARTAEELAGARYMAVRNAQQLVADADPLRVNPAAPDGSHERREVVIQDWATLNPEVKRLWIETAEVDIAAAVSGIDAL